MGWRNATVSDLCVVSNRQTAEILDLFVQVRAFAEWPGTRARFKVLSPTGEGQDLELKLITTKPLSGIARKETDKHVLKHGNSSLIVYCGGDSALEILELQPAGKRVMSAKDFLNGLRGQQLKVI